jgi:hypothetical protein
LVTALRLLQNRTSPFPTGSVVLFDLQNGEFFGRARTKQDG